MLEGLTPVNGSWVVPVGDAKGRGSQLHRQEQSRLKTVSAGLSQVPSNRIIFPTLSPRKHHAQGSWALSIRQPALENGPVPSAPSSLPPLALAWLEAQAPCCVLYFRSVGRHASMPSSLAPPTSSPVATTGQSP